MTEDKIQILKSDPVAWIAAKDIIALETLPHQIDYTAPYHMKANLAHEYLKSLKPELSSLYYEYIDETVGDYFESGMAEQGFKF